MTDLLWTAALLAVVLWACTRLGRIHRDAAWAAYMTVDPRRFQDPEIAAWKKRQALAAFCRQQGETHDP